MLKAPHPIPRDLWAMSRNLIGTYGVRWVFSYYFPTIVLGSPTLGLPYVPIKLLLHSGGSLPWGSRVSPLTRSLRFKLMAANVGPSPSGFLLVEFEIWPLILISYTMLA